MEKPQLRNLRRDTLEVGLRSRADEARNDLTRHREIFSEIFHSRIDNARLNFTLGIPQKFFGLKNSGGVLKTRYAFDGTHLD